jgi:ferredoxin-NADP reductase
MKLRLKAKRHEIADVHTFVFEPEKPTDWLPGQYMHYVIEDDKADERGSERWFTISSAPYEKHIDITTRLFEDKHSSFKEKLNMLSIGDSIEADGPKGRFVLAGGAYKHILVAGGIGVTPFHSMLKQLDHDGAMDHIELFYANKTDELLYGNYFHELEKKHAGKFKMRPFIDKRITADDLKKYFDDPTEIFYLSGPEPMVENYESMLKDAGLSQDRIRTDFFPGYEAF